LLSPAAEQYQWQSLTEFTDPYFEISVICGSNIHFVERKKKIKFLKFKMLIFCPPVPAASDEGPTLLLM
jgi:hypothetical protein